MTLLYQYHIYALFYIELTRLKLRRVPGGPQNGETGRKKDWTRRRTLSALLTKMSPERCLVQEWFPAQIPGQEAQSIQPDWDLMRK